MFRLDLTVTLTSFDYICIGETGSVGLNETSEKFPIEKQHVLYLFIFGTSYYQLNLCNMRLCCEMDCF